MKSERRRAKAARRIARLNNEESLPTKKHDEVFVTGGQCFHTNWCAALNGVWLSGATTIRTVPLRAAKAMDYDLCGNCEGEGL
jgi:hypothetical protein